MTFKQIADEYDAAIAAATIAWQQAMRVAQERLEAQMLGIDLAESAIKEQTNSEFSEEIEPETNVVNPDIEIPSRLPGGTA